MDTYIPLTKAVELLPKKNGHSFHVATLYRWAARGVNGVRLKTYKIGRQRVTTEAAMVAFFAALAEADMREAFPITRPATCQQRDRAARRARITLRMDTASEKEAR